MKTIDYYHKRRRIAVFALGGRCVKCGSRYDLELDHIDPTTKEISVGSQWSHPQYWFEIIDKCQLLCHDCHQIKSSGEASVRNLENGFTHGTSYAFWKKKCRCEVCLLAKREYYNRRNKDRRSTRDPYNLPVEHGTKRRYSRGCKCDLCRKANTDRARELRNKK